MNIVLVPLLVLILIFESILEIGGKMCFLQKSVIYLKWAVKVYRLCFRDCYSHILIKLERFLNSKFLRGRNKD